MVSSRMKKGKTWFVGNPIVRSTSLGVLMWGITSLGRIIFNTTLREKQSLVYAMISVLITFLSVEISINIFKGKKNVVTEALWLGIIWLLVYIILDSIVLLFMPRNFLESFFSCTERDMLDYVLSTGVYYFTIPIITTGMGLFVKERGERNKK